MRLWQPVCQRLCSAYLMSLSSSTFLHWCDGCDQLTWRQYRLRKRSVCQQQDCGAVLADATCARPVDITCRLRNDLYCVEWDVKLYYTIPSPVRTTLLTQCFWSSSLLCCMPDDLELFTGESPRPGSQQQQLQATRPT